MIQPKYLQKKDTVAIVSTARKIALETIKPAIQLLENWRLNDVVGDTIIFEEKQLVTSSINSSKILFNYPLENKIFNRNKTFLKLTFGGSEHLHYFAKPKELTLQKEDALLEITKNDLGFSISLHSETLQKDVFLFSTTKGKWRDNFFDLLPREKKKIQFLTESKTQPIVRIKTLNQLIQN